MIVEIKDYFEKKIKESVGNEKIEIYRSAQDESQYKFAPFCSILTSYENNEKQFTQSYPSKQNEKVLKKYDRKIVITVALAGDSEEIVDGWIDAFLSIIDSNITVKGNNVSLAVRKINYSDSDSMIRDIYIAGVLVECDTGVYVKSDIPVISEINLMNTNFNK